MRLEKEIIKKAKEKCHYENSECAIFIGGFISGYKQCLKDFNLENNLENKD